MDPAHETMAKLQWGPGESCAGNRWDPKRSDVKQQRNRVNDGWLQYPGG